MGAPVFAYSTQIHNNNCRATLLSQYSDLSDQATTTRFQIICRFPTIERDGYPVAVHLVRLPPHCLLKIQQSYRFYSTMM